MTYALREYHTLHAQLADLSSRKEDARFRLDDAAGDLTKRQQELAGRREQFERLARRRQEMEYELVQSRAALQSARQRQRYAQEQLRQIAEQV